ncbi:MAG: response regulator transcription factor, partial [Herpetosiphon sp.]|nr:response regulator transcription factor [Herpetosiphon sp.]
MKILVVDDDLELRSLISFALGQAGYLIVEAGDGVTALDVFEAEQPDLVILDVNLPKRDGFDVCRRMRAISQTPIMLLTVRNTEDDLIHGLDGGADDYLTKPFSPRTLTARVRALLRRSGGERPAPLTTGDLALDVERQTVSRSGQPFISLTNREFRLLQYLMANAKRVVTIEQATMHVWGYHGIGDRQLLKQLVHRLRQKIEPTPTEPRYLLTV